MSLIAGNLGTVQRLLDEALAEQRAENKKQVQALLADPRRFEPTQTGAHLSLSRAEVEWLFQVLNDVRVGSWVRLGSPEGKPREVTPATAPHLVAMEMAGYFQMQLLEALDEFGIKELIRTGRIALAY